MPDNLTGADRRDYMREYYHRRFAGKICLHCKRNKQMRPRGLCVTCHLDVQVRMLYPILDAPSNKRGVGNVRGYAPLPACPTHTIPGTLARQRVYEERAKAKVALHHPLDRRL